MFLQPKIQSFVTDKKVPKSDLIYGIVSIVIVVVVFVAVLVFSIVITKTKSKLRTFIESEAAGCRNVKKCNEMIARGEVN
jgi:hypothetical protein